MGLEKRFDNGAILKGEASLSNSADPDLFGSTTHAYHSLFLNLPIGSVKYIPEGSTINTTFSPLGRDIAQKLDKPIDLYELSEPFTIDHISNHWQSILK